MKQVKNMKCMLELTFIKNFIWKGKTLPRNFFSFSCVEALQNTFVYRHWVRKSPSQRDHWAVGLIAVWMSLCEFRLAFYWVPVGNPLEGTLEQLRFWLTFMPGSTGSVSLLGQFALTFRVANLEGIVMKRGPLLWAWARKPTEILLHYRKFGWRICVAKV